jgi:integrase
MHRRAAGEIEDMRKRTPPVRYGKKLAGFLRRWKRQDGAIKFLCHYNGAQIGRMYWAWWETIKKAGLDSKVTPHTLRHTRATWLMQAGIDPWEAAGHLGMSVHILQTVYGKHHPDYQKRAAEV